jgi:hypothetical protein
MVMARVGKESPERLEGKEKPLGKGKDLVP